MTFITVHLLTRWTHATTALSILCLGALVGFGAIACDDADDPGVEVVGEADPEAHPEADPEAHPEAGGSFDGSVRVQLVEWEVQPDAESIGAGSIRFVAENNGNETHELVICADSCAEGEVAELAEVEDVSAGIVRSFIVDLEPGTYELACLIEETEENGEVENHYELGMRRTIAVE